jgi:hypothetical protein
MNNIEDDNKEFKSAQRWLDREQEITHLSNNRGLLFAITLAILAVAREIRELREKIEHKPE